MNKTVLAFLYSLILTYFVCYLSVSVPACYGVHAVRRQGLEKRYRWKMERTKSKWTPHFYFLVSPGLRFSTGCSYWWEWAPPYSTSPSGRTLTLPGRATPISPGRGCSCWTRCRCSGGAATWSTPCTWWVSPPQSCLAWISNISTFTFFSNHFFTVQQLLVGLV